MRILYVTCMYPSPTHMYNGIHVKEQIEHLADKYDIDYEVYFIDGLTSKMNYIKSIYEINNLLRTGQFDLVHVHFGLAGLFMLFNPFIKIPKMVTIHGSDIGSSKALGIIKLITRSVVRKCDTAIILNDKMFGMFKHAKRLIKIPCGIDLDFFNKDRDNMGEYFTIGFPGDKNRPVKNYALFEKIVGDLIAKGYKIRPVIFHNLTKGEVVKALSRLDCLLMTSHREGSPQMVKEAMAAGVPVISSNVGDVAYLLDNVDLCHVIDSFEVRDYSDKIAELIALRPQDRVTNGGEKIAAINLDQASVCDKIHSLYFDLTSRQNKYQLKHKIL